MKYHNKTIVNSLAIKFLEQLLTKGMSVIVSIVLARLLDVEDFGIIAILTVFTNLASAIIEGGLSTSLIQMKKVDDLDYSTVFYTSGLLAVVLYIVLYLTAPYIAIAYEAPELNLYLRVTGVILFLTPFNATQLGYVYRNMLFKRLFISSVFASILSGICGIVLAMLGAGIWALIAQIVSASVTSVLVLFMIIPWKPKMQFSLKRLKLHFSYGWKMLVSSLVDTLYIDLQALIIGKRYTKDDLAYYNNGDKYPKTLILSLNTAVQSVMLPVFSTEQDDTDSLKRIMRKTVSYSSFLLFPIMFGFAAVAENFVLVALTEKWLDCVIYLQLACLAYAIRPINSCNLQAIKAIGRSDIFLHLTLIKKAIGITVVILTALCFPTPLAIAIGVALCSPLELVINIIPNRKLIGYTLREQVSDIAFPLLMSLVMFVGVNILTNLSLNVWIELLIQVVVGVVIYAVMTVIFKRDILLEGINIIKNKFHRKD
ncbi:MAG: lipopolysaccharide biosynthesis protein [Clostridia bacterium]|nr:lipopolysaccharide biosynthesis protein [Clostridia bacterium]